VLSVGVLRTSAIKRQRLCAEHLVSWPHPSLAPDSLLEAVLHIVFLYDSLECIEFQDYGGLFFRVPQAKRSALLPPHVLCRAVCHGNSFYFERMTKKFQRAAANLTHLWEKVTVELADEVVFPTNYAHQLYCRELGLRPLGSVLVRHFPFHSQEDDGTRADPQPADTIVFLGAQMSDNGWPEFRQAVATLPGYGTVRLDPDAADLSGLLAELSSRSVVVVAKALCGYPYPMMQAIDTGCAVLMLGAFGVDEVIPPGFRDQVSALEKNGPGLRDALSWILALSPSVRCAQAHALRDAMRDRHQAALTAWCERPLPLPHTSAGAGMAQNDSPVTVVVPVYNRPFGEIEELILGLNSQTLQPREVIFVDDASDEDFTALYAGKIRSLLRVPARFIRHERNRGLSGARNTGLYACDTQFVAMHDSDNIAANDFLYRGCLALVAAPALDAVTFELMAFPDGDDWTNEDPKWGYHRPIGDGVVQSLASTNCFGDAMAVYRVVSTRECGGWDECSRAMWEDLAFFIKLSVSGRRVMNAPGRQVFYRIREHSMQRTGSEYDARQRLVRMLSALSPFEAFCLQRLALMQENPKPRSSRELLLDALHQYLDRKPRLLRTFRTARSVGGRVREAWDGIPRGRETR
jgi:GT2 family glycosyltransferase